MVSNLFFYQLVLIALVWLFLMLHWLWPSESAAARRLTPAQPVPPPRKRSTASPNPFRASPANPTATPVSKTSSPAPPPPSAPPPPLISTRGRRRQVDTSHHFCPDPDCRYGGWLGLGNISANGHPSGGPWRQLYCSRCEGYFLETHGTLFHGKRVSRSTSWCGRSACLAEGLGIRGVARVFEVDPNTVLRWLVEAAEQLQAFSRYFLHDVHVTQVQLDELYALLSAVKDGQVSEAEAIERLSRSPHWVWVAIDPVTKLLLTIDVGDRTLAMAQRVVHQVVAGVGARLCAAVSDRRLQGVHDGVADPLRPVGAAATPPGHRPRAQAALDAAAAAALCAGDQDRAAPAPGRVRHRVVFGTLEAVQQVLAACGWQINTAFVERVNLTIRQHVAAVGRRVITLCKGEDGVAAAAGACTTCTIISACRMPAYASRCPSPSRPTARARPSAGSHGRRRWPRD